MAYVLFAVALTQAVLIKMLVDENKVLATRVKDRWREN